MPITLHTHRLNKPRSGVALGGIGTGCFELRQDGSFQNWSICNNYPLNRGASLNFHGHSMLFFVVRYQVEGETPRLKLLQIEESHDSAAISSHEFQYMFPWLSGVDRIDYSATVPFVQLAFSDDQMPLDIRLKAWSPLIPRDLKNSSLPLAMFDFEIASRTPRPVTVSLYASLRSAVGHDVRFKSHTARACEGENYRAFEMSCAGMNPAHSSFGTMALASLHADSHYYLGWEHHHPYYEVLLANDRLPDINDTAGRNPTDAATGKPAAGARCFSTIGRTFHFTGAGQKEAHTFACAWHFPNRYAQLLDEAREPALGESAEPKPDARIEGHYYSNFFADASQVAAYAVSRRESLLEETRRFHDAFYASSVETWVLDQINSHLNTLRTSSWLTREGNGGILEGLSPTQSFAGLATTDVAMYGQVLISALFPELDRNTWRAHRHFQFDNGVIAHSIGMNFRDIDPKEADGQRIDLPAQYSCMSLRAGLWADDRERLRDDWPSVRKALDYVLRERDKNGDLLPDMEGIMCSYDNFAMYGVAPYVACQWLAALRMAVETAKLLGDKEAERRYGDAFQSGSATLEKLCWNGSYYRLWAKSAQEKDEGCLTDQLLGLWALHFVGLAPLLDPEKNRAALREVIRRNYKPDEGLRNCSWPGDAFLHPIDKDTWIDQANTCWTGVETAFASLLIYEGLVDEGLMVLRNVDERYRKLGMYWDHQEFGGHYFRPMAAWGIIHALAGFSLCAGRLRFAPRLDTTPLRLFFSTPDGYGHYVRRDREIEVRVLSGKLAINELALALPAGIADDASLSGSVSSGAPLQVTRAGDTATLSSAGAIEVPAGEAISLRW